MLISEEDLRNWFFPSTVGPGIDLSFPAMERVGEGGGRLSIVHFGVRLCLSALPMPVHRSGCCTAPLMAAQGKLPQDTLKASAGMGCPSHLASTAGH